MDPLDIVCFGDLGVVFAVVTAASISLFCFFAAAAFLCFFEGGPLEAIPLVFPWKDQQYGYL